MMQAWRSGIVPVVVGAMVGTLAAAGRAADETAYTLRYRFAPDEVVHHCVTHKVMMTTRKGDHQEAAFNESVAWKHYRVVEVQEDGSATLELVIDRVRMSAHFNQDKPVTVDSRRPDECPTPYRGVLKTIGQPLARITFSPRGQMQAVQKALPRDVQREVAAGEDEETPDTDPGKNPLVILPEEPVRVGDSWEDDFEARVSVTRTLKQPVTLRRKYTLESVEGSVARIGLKTAVLTPIRDPSLQAQLIQRAPTGTIEFDLEKGTILSRKLTSDETVVGALGPNSLMHATSERVETVLSPSEAAAQTASTPAQGKPGS